MIKTLFIFIFALQIVFHTLDRTFSRPQVTFDYSFGVFLIQLFFISFVCMISIIATPLIKKRFPQDPVRNPILSSFPSSKGYILIIVLWSLFNLCWNLQEPRDYYEFYDSKLIAKLFNIMFFPTFGLGFFLDFLSNFLIRKIRTVKKIEVQPLKTFSKVKHVKFFEKESFETVYQQSEIFGEALSLYSEQTSFDKLYNKLEENVWRIDSVMIYRSFNKGIVIVFNEKFVLLISNNSKNFSLIVRPLSFNSKSIQTRKVFNISEENENLFRFFLMSCFFYVPEMTNEKDVGSFKDFLILKEFLKSRVVLLNEKTYDFRNLFMVFQH